MWTDSTDRSRRPTRSLFSTAACHRWPRWLRSIPDDDHNEPSLSFTRLLARRLARWRDWQQPDTSDGRPLSGPFPSTSPFFFPPEPEPQKRSGAHCFPIRGCRRSCRNKALLYEFASATISTQLDDFNNRRAEHGSEFTNRHKEEQRFVPRHARAGLKLNLTHLCFTFQQWHEIFTLHWIFLSNIQLFHVTHTNPAAISLSLNRAESLYLNSLAEHGAAVVGIAVTGWPGQKEKPQSCVWV